MKIVGRWDESDPYDAHLNVADNITFSSKYAVAIPLVLSQPSYLIKDSGPVVFKASGSVTVDFKLNLSTSNASSNKNYDVAVIYFLLNGNLVEHSVCYASPSQGDGALTCVGIFPLNIEINDTLELFVYRIVKSGRVQVIPAESLVNIVRKKINV